MELRLANDRGLAEHGWLSSRHSFSFGRYYDPEHMGFSDLRVINDDYVQPACGFDMHGHRDMEIFTYVHLARGALCINEHTLHAGDALKLRYPEHLEISQGQDAELLVFDLRPEA
ncbi:hypothetical protein SAMN05216526_0938 [Ectothiorhodosinus mongolicus]|uniref:Quercetin 2,3-dioxygenase C-terminal cupin domain-containing protein n=1 Tax=Ectothiorhodosinus mongolicus TaxID=233100 RepID=A0A1R3VUX6_9GAMM|nr:pirin family protein [Ectothiorhodosinus mongolicus]ULX56885.1 hypothetical protein CKX93_03700 [Ectothiorhodosinus mongolicus]SIT68806.1 hypothetical protein SAMN05216526_0938 [Ectothiorhodosinus mongolicus]